ncbi:hypothetical protein ACH4PW_20465 [Streptomyces sp. NPDC017082]|uniref:hypothetical protein n=1 Tax=Streptomyces sp. NPDC017082 TaxID=3364974 RepID=UPI0037AC92A8
MTRPAYQRATAFDGFNGHGTGSCTPPPAAETPPTHPAPHRATGLGHHYALPHATRQ